MTIFTTYSVDDELRDIDDNLLLRAGDVIDKFFIDVLTVLFLSGSCIEIYDGTNLLTKLEISVSRPIDVVFNNKNHLLLVLLEDGMVIYIDSITLDHGIFNTHHRVKVMSVIGSHYTLLSSGGRVYTTRDGNRLNLRSRRHYIDMAILDSSCLALIRQSGFADVMFDDTMLSTNNVANLQGLMFKRIWMYKHKSQYRVIFLTINNGLFAISFNGRSLNKYEVLELSGSVKNVCINDNRLIYQTFDGRLFNYQKKMIARLPANANISSNKY